MPTPSNPVAFSLFGFDIKWYAVFIVSAMAISSLVLYKRAPKHSISEDDILTAILIGISSGIIGARVYYIAFNFEYYKHDIVGMLNIRNGGLAIHGGLILGLLSVYAFCKYKKISFLNLADLSAPMIAFSQAVGRFGNYFNNEAYGSPTNLPWGIIIDGQKVHPTFLYESIWCFLIFAVLIYIDNRRKFDGQVFFIYLTAYSFERFFVEYLRTDSLMIGPFKQAMLLSFIVFVIAVALYIIHSKKSGDSVCK